MPAWGAIGFVESMNSKLYLLLKMASIQSGQKGNNDHFPIVSLNSNTNQIFCYSKITKIIAYKNRIKTKFLVYIVEVRQSIRLLSCQPRETVTSFFVYKVSMGLSSLEHMCISPISRIGLIHK